MGEPVDHSDGAEGDNDSDDAEEEIGKEPHYLNFLAKKILRIKLNRILTKLQYSVPAHPSLKSHGRKSDIHTYLPIPAHQAQF